MSKISKYYNVTEKDEPRKNVKYFVENIKVNPTKVIDLGCGQGNDTVFLIKSGWRVLGIDRENVEERIRKRLSEDKQDSFYFELQDFEKLILTKTDLIVANFSLSFCNNKKFKNTWNIIEESILPGGYFVGNFLGNKDSWTKTKHKMTFLNIKEIKRMFENFRIIKFDEIENDKATALGSEKHWHFFNIIAKKQ